MRNGTRTFVRLLVSMIVAAVAAVAGVGIVATPAHAGSNGGGRWDTVRLNDRALTQGWSSPIYKVCGSKNQSFSLTVKWDMNVMSNGVYVYKITVTTANSYSSYGSMSHGKAYLLGNNGEKILWNWGDLPYDINLGKARTDSRSPNKTITWKNGKVILGFLISLPCGGTATPRFELHKGW